MCECVCKGLLKKQGGGGRGKGCACVGVCMWGVVKGRRDESGEKGQQPSEIRGKQTASQQASAWL